MANYWLVTSGINAPYTSLTPNDKLSQVVDTARSIKVKDLSAQIILLDSGCHPLTMTQRKHLLSEYDDILDFAGDSFIRTAHSKSDPQAMTLKGPCETYVLKAACMLLDVTDADRIFKMTGRYQLNDQFDLEQHQSARRQYVFRKDLGGEPLSELYVKTDYQYVTTLYSFCGSLLRDAVQNYHNIFNTILSCYNNERFSNLEHITWAVMCSYPHIKEVNIVGVEGIYSDRLIKVYQ